MQPTSPSVKFAVALPASRGLMRLMGGRGRGVFASLVVTAAMAACGTAAIDSAVPDRLDAPELAHMGDSGAAQRHDEPSMQRAIHNHNFDPNRWASGTTALFTHAMGEDRPFGSRDGTECAVTCAASTPACALMDSAVPERRDISGNQECLPMRLMLRVLRPDCLPVSGAQVSVWHPSPSGNYSGPTGRPKRCAPRDPHAARKLTFRGQQTTGTLGEATFDTCFPGASPGHTTTVNLEVSRDGQLILATQLLFDDAMVADIEATQPLYAARARAIPPTRNHADPNIRSAFVQPMTLDVVQMPDGTMLAYTSVVVPADAPSPSCSAAKGQDSAENSNERR